MCQGLSSTVLLLAQMWVNAKASWPHAKLWIFMYTLDLCKILCTMAVQNSQMSVQNCVCAAVCLDIPRFLFRPLGERPCIHVYTHQISRDQLTCIYQLPYECIQHQRSHYNYRPIWRDLDSEPFRSSLIPRLFPAFQCCTQKLREAGRSLHEASSKECEN